MRPSSSLAPPSSATATTIGPGARSRGVPTAGLEPRYTQIGRALVSGGTGTDLFVLTYQFLVRYELDAGRITRTIAPNQSSAPTFLLANGPDVIVRPYDNVPGYSIRDDGERRDLTGRLANGAFGVFPAADPAHVWVFDDDGGHGDSYHITAFTTDGRIAGEPIATPGLWPVGPDGAGNVLLASPTDGVSVAGVNGVSHVTSGTVVATGAAAFVVDECLSPTSCQLSVIDRATGKRRRLGPTPTEIATDALGAVSPDGRFAAIAEHGRVAHELHLLDLGDGHDDLVGAVAPWPSLSPAIAWSPDSRWLFYDNAPRGLTAVEPAVGRQVLVETDTRVIAMAARRSPPA